MRPKPSDTDILTNVKAVVAGGDHSCALMVSGGLRCWGDNSEGVLGDGSDVEFRARPPSADVPGLDHICPP
jgi:alpha-tubulin suppressor-like RCC1 family protein